MTSKPLKTPQDICVNCMHDENEHMETADRICQHACDCRGFDNGSSKSKPLKTLEQILDCEDSYFNSVEGHRQVIQELNAYYLELFDEALMTTVTGGVVIDMTVAERLEQLQKGKL